MSLSSASLRKKAEALAALLPIERLDSRALSFGVGAAPPASRRRETGSRQTRKLAPAAPPAEREAWAVALSGGADSVALLLLLWAHWPERRGDLLALHYNHQLRGAAADEDEQFCKKLCRALGVKLAVGRAGEREAVGAGGCGGGRGGRGAGLALRSEAQAREARFAFFAKKMAAARARLLWLGHQKNDVAETLLMRLTRGSGPSGLAAPRPVQVINTGDGEGRAAPREEQIGQGSQVAGPACGASRTRARAVSDGRGGRVHLRPLLTLARAEIEAALRRCEIPWREDATNAEGDFFRNRIRRDVLPALVAAAGGAGGAGEARGAGGRGGRDALAGMALARELIDEDDAALDAWAQEVFDLCVGRASVGRMSPKGCANASLANWDETDALDLRLWRDSSASLLRTSLASSSDVSPTSATPKAPSEGLPLSRLPAPPRAVLRRVLHRWLRECAGAPSLSRAAFEQLLTAVERGQSTRQSLGKSGFALIRRGVLRLERNTQ